MRVYLLCVRAYLMRGLPRPPSSPRSLCVTVCRHNELGAEGGTAVAQALRHLPQLQTLHLGCALARTQPARDGSPWRAARSYRVVTVTAHAPTTALAFAQSATAAVMATVG